MRYILGIQYVFDMFIGSGGTEPTSVLAHAGTRWVDVIGEQLWLDVRLHHQHPETPCTASC